MEDRREREIEEVKGEYEREIGLVKEESVKLEEKLRGEIERVEQRLMECTEELTLKEEQVLRL